MRILYTGCVISSYILLNNNSRFVYEQNQKQKSIFMVIDRCDRHRKKIKNHV